MAGAVADKNFRIWLLARTEEFQGAPGFFYAAVAEEFADF